MMPLPSKALLLFALSATALVPPSSRVRRITTAQHAVKLPDIVSLFGRLAETTCVDDDGSELSAAKPKWIPAYTERGDHMPLWVASIFPAGEPVDRTTFDALLEIMEFSPPLAAPASDAARGFSHTGAAALWTLLAQDGDSLDAPGMAAGLAAIATEGGGVQWSDYEEAVRDLEVERSSDLASLSFADDDWEASANDEGAGQLMADAGAAADDWAPPPPTVAVAGEKTEGGLFLS
mmetsp:Transcript_6180/g.18271  ORF Transcript_6180/g.18271 Transcript_6180/m.18271 type:complete len:235 (-) Transcript_6180:16-720(-)